MMQDSPVGHCAGESFVCMRSGKLAALQEWMNRSKSVTSARLSTEALESCFRRVICREVNEGKPPALTAQVAFLLPKEVKCDIVCLAA